MLRRFGDPDKSAWLPAIAVRRTASLPLAYVRGFYVLGLQARKTWMAGINPAMTEKAASR
jgi:hypothetical protein